MALPGTLGRLQRVRRLGSGGFATVWLYHDPELDSDVAVKALADNWAARSDVRERFLNEARLLRRADSDHVVRVHDVGEADGTPYFVMTYADAGTVADLVGSTPGPVEVADVVDQAARGLQRLHEIGVVHRDVKPQNLLLIGRADGRRRVMVADLGVAKALAAGSGITQVVGSEAYMAPEQADPTGGVDARADVHALGMVARALLTGSTDREVPLDGPAGPVVERATAPDRDARWPDVRSFADALGRAVGRREDGPTVLGTADPVARTSQRRWTRVALGVAAVLVVVAGGIGAQWFLEDGAPGPAGERPQGVAPVSAPRMDLGEDWDRRPDTRTHTDYEREDGTRLSLDAAVVEIAPQTVARLGALRSSTLRDYTELRLSELPASVRGPWQSGWQMQYAWTGADGDRVEGWTWVLGNAGATAGYVGVRASPGESERFRETLVDARRQVLDAASAIPTRSDDDPPPVRVPTASDLPDRAWTDDARLRGLTCSSLTDPGLVAVAPTPRRWRFDRGTVSPCSATGGTDRTIELSLGAPTGETGRRQYTRSRDGRDVDVLEVYAGGWQVVYTAPEGELDERTVTALTDDFVGTPGR